MKRVLLATTALCMGAGTAVADVALSGVAEMGVAASKDNSVRFHTDVNVTFTLSGETDAGVAFGSAIELAESGDGSAAVDDDDNHGGIAVHMSDPDGFGTLTLGDTDGGYDWAMIEVGSGGIRDDSEHGAWNGNGGLDGKHDGQILRWDRDIAAGFAFGASVELHDHKDNAPSNDPILGFGGTYSMGMGAGTLALGGGVQMGSFDHTIEGGLTAAERAAKADKPVIWGTATPTPVGTVGATGSSAGASVTKGRTVEGREVEGMIVGGSAKMDFGGDGGGISVTLNGSVMEADGSHTSGTGDAARTMTADVEKTHLGVGFGYTVGGISLGLNVGSMVTESRVDPNNAVNTAGSDHYMIDETVTGVGFDVAYDLGGGATLKFGVGSHETEYDYTYARDSAASGASGTGANAAGHDYSSDTNKWSLGVAFAF